MTTPADQLAVVHKKCRELRTRKDLALKELTHLKKTFTGFDGVERPLKVRYYQIQGALHLFLMRRFLLGDDTGLGKCCRLDTRILTDAGMVEIGSLAPKGVKLKADTFYDLDTPVQVWTGWEWAPVKHYYHCGEKPTLKVRTRRGYDIEGSLVHPLWVRTSERETFCQTQNLKIGDFVCLDRSESKFPAEEPCLPLPDTSSLAPNARIYTVPDHLTPELAILLGYITAEGWANNLKSICVAQDVHVNPEVYSDIVQGILSCLGYAPLKVSDGVNIHSTYLRAYFKGLGVGLCLSKDKCVPWPIFQGTRQSVIGFLRAFFDAEGSVRKGAVEVSSASEQMLKDIQILLLRFGIMSSRSSKRVKGHSHTYWRLALCGDDLRRFKDSIGFITPRKQKALNDAFQKNSNSNLDVVPYTEALIDSLRTELLLHVSKIGSNESRKGSGLKQFGISFEKTLNNIRNTHRKPTYRFLHQLRDALRYAGVPDGHPDVVILQGILDQHFFYDPIVEIVESRSVLADIEVEHPRHSFVANGFVNHNTLTAIIGLCLVWSKEPDKKAIVFTTKSSVEQWSGEFAKFTRGVKVIISSGTPRQREQARDLFLKATGPTVLIMGYRGAVQDISHLQDWGGHILIFDEATAFKNPKTQVHQVCRHMAGKADRVWALTATLIKNHLMEGFGVYQVVMPGIFMHPTYKRPMTANQFMIYYAVVRMQRIPRSNRQIPVIVGYSPEKIREFKDAIDPYFLGRPKHEVASELPVLVNQIVNVDMSPEQETKYKEALDGLLEVGNGEEKVTDKLTALIYCQQIVNDLELIGIEAPSPKVEALMELLTEGDFEDEKVIVFSRFRKMVDILMQVLKAKKIPAVRVTGAENGEQRAAAMKAFQDPNDPTRVCCITTAGSEAINLQAAKALICFDTPWSAGDFLQLIGRMVRIGSAHDRCYVIHLVAKGHKKTIDHRVMEVLHKKMQLVEAVLGKRLKGEGDTGIIDAQNEISDLFHSLQEDARED